jgi:hypothetical protein
VLHECDDALRNPVLATVVLRRAPKNSRPDLDYVGG